MTKSILSHSIEKQYLHKVSVWKYAFYLHVSTRCCHATSFWWNERSKNHTLRHERFLEFCVKFASILKMSNCTKSHFGNMVSTYIFLPDVVLPQVFDETKDQKIIRKDMKDSWNSVLDLLVYPKCPIKWNSGPQVQNYSLKTLTLLDDCMLCSGWHCTFCIAVSTVWNNSNVLSGVWHVC